MLLLGTALFFGGMLCGMLLLELSESTLRRLRQDTLTRLSRRGSVSSAGKTNPDQQSWSSVLQGHRSPM